MRQMQPASPPPVHVAARLLRSDNVPPLVILLLTTLVVALILLFSPLRIGLWGDDNTYLATSRALADGRGYRHIQLPGEPWQTKYPILFPLVLAGVWKIAPDFPQNVRIMQTLNVVWWAIGSWFCYLAMRQLWNLPRWLLTAGIVLAFLGTSTLPLLQAVMSEALYFCLTMAALFVLLRLSPSRHGQTSSASRQPRTNAVVDVVERTQASAWTALLVGLLTGLAFLTRPIGITLIASVLIYLLLRRRWRHAVAAALPILACVVGHKIWLIVAQSRNALIPVASAFGYDLGYGPSSLSSLSTFLRVVYHNTSDMGLSLAIVLNPFLSEAWIDSRLNAGPVAALPLYALMVILGCLVILGAAVLWRRDASAVHLYVLCYVGLLWIWIGSPWRFLLVILPILVVFVLTGTYVLLTWLTKALYRAVQRRVGGSQGPRSTPANARAIVPRSIPATALVVTAVVVFGLKSLYNNTAPVTLRVGAQYDRALEGLVTLLMHATPPDAVICANTGGYLHLRTGRKFVPYLAYEDQIPFRYPPDRRFAMCGRGTTEAQYDAYMGLIFDHLLPYLHTTGATFLVIRENEQRTFEEFRQTVPDCFSQLAITRPYILYRVRLPCGDAL